MAPDPDAHLLQFICYPKTLIQSGAAALEVSTLLLGELFWLCWERQCYACRAMLSKSQRKGCAGASNLHWLSSAVLSFLCLPKYSPIGFTPRSVSNIMVPLEKDKFSDLVRFKWELNTGCKVQPHRCPVQRGHHTALVGKLSSTYPRKLLNCSLSAVLYFQQSSGRLMSAMRTRTSDGKTFLSCLKNISSASSMPICICDCSHQSWAVLQKYL